MVYSLPLALIVFVFLIIRRAWAGPLETYVLQTDGEMGHLVFYLETVREDAGQKSRPPLVLVLNFPWHAGFDELYANGLGWRILWPKRIAGLVSQALLLQPRFVRSEIRMNQNYLKKMIFLGQQKGVARPTVLSWTALEPTHKLVNRRRTLLRSVGLEDFRYVLLSVFSRAWEEEMNPQYAHKTRPKETKGAELAAGIDYLYREGVGVVLVGAEDSGDSRIPREFPRLRDIGSFGGLDEVALASACCFFWTDAVGAHWIAKPYSTSVLVTNHYVLGAPREATRPLTVVPLLYQRPNGHICTLTEMIEDSGLFRRVTPRGDLVRIRNTPQEIVEALKEMIARTNGTYVEDEESLILRERAAEIYSHYSSYEPFFIASSFLKRHPELLS
jgi:putative glycosyltransferase (TIGR04372 family)